MNDRRSVLLRAPHGVSRRRAVRWLAGGAGILAAACAPFQAPSEREPAALAGTFELMNQNFAPGIAIIKQVIEKFQQQHPAAKVVLSIVPYDEMATKTRIAVAAGAPPDGFHTYTLFWRGADPANVFMRLTPQLFKRNELERMFFPNMLDTVWSKDQQVYILPYSAGVGAAMVLHNKSLLAADGVDPKSFTTLDALIAGATRLVRRQGGTITRAGLLTTGYVSLIPSWILDQGGRFYNEQTRKWSWQTVEAERTFQWLLDLYDRHAVAWRKAPEGVRNPIGEGRAAMQIDGAFALSSLAASHPDTPLADQVRPGFVPGRPQHFFENGISGYALSALLRPDAPKARIGAAFYRELLSPDSALIRAENYSGAILIKGLYLDQRFKQTAFYAARAKFSDQVISKIKIMNMAANPVNITIYVNKIIDGQLSIKSALLDMQQKFTSEEEEARRNLGI